jgi:MoxR-like ATPases
MPSDILGAEVLDESNSGKRSFRFIAGPVFAQLLMADEINRASPRTQSALAAGDAGQHITVAGARTICRSRSTCSRRKTRWSRKAPIRCRKPSSTAS